MTDLNWIPGVYYLPPKGAYYQFNHDLYDPAQLSKAAAEMDVAVEHGMIGVQVNWIGSVQSFDFIIRTLLDLATARKLYLWVSMPEPTQPSALTALCDAIHQNWPDGVGSIHLTDRVQNTHIVHEVSAEEERARWSGLVQWAAAPFEATPDKIAVEPEPFVRVLR